MFIHPRPPGSGLAAAIASFDSPQSLVVFTGATVEYRDLRKFATSTWDLRSVGTGYTRFCARFAPLAGATSKLSDDAAFAARFALVFDFLKTAWADPELPAELLPTTWPGHKARHLANKLYRQLLPPSLRYANAVARS